MVTYRIADEVDYVRINEFYNRIYNRTRTMEEFRWNFHDCPFGKSIYAIAEDDGNIIGTNAVIPIELITSDGSIILSGKSEDTLVDPGYRGQGVFPKIYDLLFEHCDQKGISVIWGFTDKLKAFKRVGFSHPFSLEQDIIVHDVSKSYAYLSASRTSRSVVDKAKLQGFCALSKVKFGSKSSTLPEGISIKREGAIADVEDVLTQNLNGTEALFAIRQTTLFQAWRIYSNPYYHEVHSYNVYSKNEIAGVVTIHSTIEKVAQLIHSTLHPQLSIEESSAILRAIINDLFSKGIIMIRTWTFEMNELNKKEGDVFKKSGFTHVKSGLGFIWKVLDDSLLRPEDFFLSNIASQGT